MNDNMLKASNQKMVLDQSLSKKGPAALVIMGVTGDLARNKLIPALFRLYRRKALPEQFFLIGFSRRPLNNSDFAKLITDSLERFSATSQELAEFIVRATYIQGNFDNSDSYQNLFTNLVSLSKTTASPLQVLLYVATPPSVYETIFSQLAILEAGATRHLRILIEKPFGHDSRTAAALDRRLGELFTEQQIFRIDHYLAKETVQNIMTFRFANSMFEPIWNREHIERVEIRLLERNDVSNRGNFYHDVGALRDVGQNHLLQMLALVAMEDPGSFSAVGRGPPPAHGSCLIWSSRRPSLSALAFVAVSIETLSVNPVSQRDQRPKLISRSESGSIILAGKEYHFFSRAARASPNRSPI
jgi:glucose-6-phosphate 1-dehydrogenase